MDRLIKSPVRGFVTFYLGFMMIGALLMLLFGVRDGETLSFIDALFLSASALSTTGLSPVVVKDVLNPAGQTVLLIIIQFGGIGLIMLLAIVWLIARTRINYSQRTFIMTDQNQVNREGIVKFLKRVIILIVLIELIGFIIFFTIIMARGYFGSGLSAIGPSLWQAGFTVISLFTNAGFDIMPGADSLFLYRSDYILLTVSMLIMFLGAVGFWPLNDWSEYLITKFKKKPKNETQFKFQIFTKWFFYLHFGTWIFSAIILALIELTSGGFYESMSYSGNFIQTVFDFLFMSLTTRNAGFSTIPVTDFSEPGRLFMMFLMFLGSSPNSAGGGIRTITLFIVIITIISFSKGRKATVLKHRKVTIKSEDTQKAFIVVVMASALILSVVFVMALVEPFSLSDIMFEVSSAFGTTGLSTGITSELSTVSKLSLIVTMFIGRVGLLALMMLFRNKNTSENNLAYPEIDVIVG